MFKSTCVLHRGVVGSAAGLFALAACCAGALGAGADIVYTGISGVTTYGPVNGKLAYALGSQTCNIGDQNSEWTNGGLPGLAMNVYRIHDGRIVQLGQSHVKHSCCAAAGNGCGLTCNGVGGSQLGVGCLDSYGSSYNGGFTRLGPKSGINPWTGVHSTYSTASGDAIYKRAQVLQSDMNTTTFANAVWITEGVYVALRDAQAGNRNNNASYRRVTNTGNGTTLTVTGTTQVGMPAIQAWRDLGNNGAVDTNVTIGQVDVPGEGRYWYGYKSRDLSGTGAGPWRYEYAVFNLSSHLSGGALEIPVPAGVNVSNMGFSAPSNHSLDPYANTAWAITRTSDTVKWETESITVNVNANALRWGSMYNFWFDADRPPAAGTVNARLGLFRPHTPDHVGFGVSVPGVPGCDSIDYNNDGLFPSTLDIDDFLSVFSGGPCSTPNCNDIDFNNDSLTPDTADIDALLSVFSGGPCL
jgi:hypothetical protein